MTSRVGSAGLWSGCALLLLVAIGAAACSGDDDGSTPVTPPVVDGGSRPDVTTGPDAASITPRPELCEGLALGADAISELELASDPPAALGGEILPGTYDLTELNVYAGPQPEPTDGGERPPSTRLTGQAAQATIVVSEFALRTIETSGAAGALPAARASAVLFRIAGTSLVETAVCPTTALPVSRSYSAVGNGLAIFYDAKHRALYVRR